MDLMFLVLLVSVLLSPLANTAPQDIGLEPNSTKGTAILDLSAPGEIGRRDCDISWGPTPGLRIPGLTFCRVVILALSDLALANYNEYIPLPMEFRYPEYNGMGITVGAGASLTEIIRKYVVIALFYLLRGAAEANTFGQGLLLISLRNQLVALIRVEKREHLLPAASSNSSNPAAEQLSSSNATAIVDVEHYSSSFVPYPPMDDFDLAQEPTNSYYNLYYNFYGSSFPVGQYFITLAFWLARLAGRDAGVVLTQVDETSKDSRNHLLVTSWQRPSRTQPPFFLNRLAVRGLRDLAKAAVKDRKFQEVEAVIQREPQTPVGFVNVTRIEVAPGGKKGAGEYDVSEQVEVL